LIILLSNSSQFVSFRQETGILKIDSAQIFRCSLQYSDLAALILVRKSAIINSGNSSNNAFNDLLSSFIGSGSMAWFG